MVSDAVSALRYRNPILPGFYPDPSVVRVGDTFYLVNSSFEMFPGVPIHRSRDLVHWEPLGHVLTRDSQLPLASARASGGIFAPTIRHHAGTFYMVTTNVSQGGNFFVSARDPAGPWSEPVWTPGQRGIDPSLFFDADGKVYLTSTGSPSGIYQSQIDIATGALLTSPPRLIWQGSGGRYPEGPHLYAVNGRYYLMISEGGTEYGHMVTIARSHSPWGPFEPCPHNPIVTHRNTGLDQPIQGVGHAELIEDGEGNWWMVFLAIRPQGGYYWHHLGRETFLAPVRWSDDGWPVVNENRPIGLDMVASRPRARPLPNAPVRDEFEPRAPTGSSPGFSPAHSLGPAWNFLRNPVPSSYSLGERPGWLTLHGTPVSLERAEGASPTFVGRRQQHLRARMATRIDFEPREGEEAGLVLYRTPGHRYELGVRRSEGRREVFVRQTVGTYLSVVTASAPAPGGQPLLLEIEAEPSRYTFAWAASPAASPPPSSAASPQLQRIGAAETRLLATEVTGGFIGVYVGLYAVASEAAAGATPAAFDWFDYEARS
ncbi:MAG TPA: glycoside hydrolase family 43 protein [Polyangiaceae bacterium]|nr:glycoside hydrolase family 43 protein [Polyangiaceae bacterium]